MLLKFSIIAVFILGLFLAGPSIFAYAESPQKASDDTITIKANYKEQLEERIFATGDVEIHYKNIKLFADSIELNTETKDVFARGNVVIQMPDEQLSVEEILINLDSTEGTLQKGFGLVQPTVRYEAETIERKDANFYRFHKASITSCTQTNPRWKFSFSKANFKKNDYIEMWNSVLSIKKIPVFYLPYMRYPLGKEKSTGFLTPQLGFSGRKGMVFAQGFYWALKRNMDATINYNYYSTRGMGGGLEYRYLFSQGTGGRLNLYYFFFKEDPERETPPNAYIFRFNHNQPLPHGFAIVADVDYQSSFDFLREFDNDYKRALVSNRRSQVYLFRYWSYYKLYMQVSRFETHFTEINDSVISYNFPQINFSIHQLKLFNPLYFSFSSSFRRWEYGWQWQYQNNSQSQSQSLALTPALTLPFKLIPWVSLSCSFVGKFNYYFQSYDPSSWRVVDEPILTSNFVLHTKLVGPVFYKIYYGAQGEAKVKHVIEPYCTYHYESPVGASDRIITPAGFFRFHYVRYGINNHVIVRENKKPRTIFTLGVSNTFYIAEEESPLNRFRVEGVIPQFEDIRGYIRFYPLRKYRLDFSAGFNPYFKTFSSLRMTANFGNPGDLVNLRVNWYKGVNPYQKKAWYNRHQIGCAGGFRIPKYSLEAWAQFDFNIQQRKMLYSAVSLTYHYHCLDFLAYLKIFYFRDKPEMQFRVTFGLGNIGKTTDFLGGAEF
ncbi:MAG: LPS-assembly protein LptD [Candidatus Aminicenantes bacterium]|nr:MAG: LPS-assembly protein LptD [Candidatus Aminicenantes bacterium]